MPVTGIHHVTAVTATIVENLKFYTESLGMRLVKKSVNQDDVRAYHLFYADAAGSPGTDLTFFDWPMSPANVPGPGTITATTLRVDGGLDWWEKRLSEQGLISERDEDELGLERLSFADPEGQSLELVDAAGLPGAGKPWTASVPAERSIRGILGVEIATSRPDATARVLTELLGLRMERNNETAVFETRTDESVGRVRLRPVSGRLGRVGAGGVHHVAFRVPDDDALNEYQQRIEAAGLQTSGYVDRFWFHSLYFREPGGVLFELATDGPGFTADESLESLGSHLTLAPFLEPQRAEIESHLRPLPEPVGAK